MVQEREVLGGEIVGLVEGVAGEEMVRVVVDFEGEEGEVLVGTV